MESTFSTTDMIIFISVALAFMRLMIYARKYLKAGKQAINQAKHTNHMIKLKLHIYLLFFIFLLPFRNTAQVCRQRSFQGFCVASLGSVYY